MNILLFALNDDLKAEIMPLLQAEGHESTAEHRLEFAIKKILYHDFDLIITASTSFEHQQLIRSSKLHRHKIKILLIEEKATHQAMTATANLLSSEAPELRPDSRLNSNVDNILRHPFSPEDFEETLIHLEQNHNVPYQPFLGEPLMLGDLTMYPDRYEAFREGEKIPLRKKEFQLLEFMMRHKNKVINRHAMLEYVWNYENQAQTNTLDVHISSLRRKVDGCAANVRKLAGRKVKAKKVDGRKRSASKSNKASHNHSVSNARKPALRKPMIHTVYGAGYKLSEE